MRIPGLALGIVHNDEVVHLRGFGEADPAGRTVTPQTPFILASASKSFTALAIMQLVESGKVDLDAPVRRYLAAFRVADEAASAQITVRHLLHHTSGLPEDSAFGPMLSNDVRDEALSDRVHALERRTAQPWRRHRVRVHGRQLRRAGACRADRQRPVLRVLHRRARLRAAGHEALLHQPARRSPQRSGHRPSLLVRLPQALRGAVLAGRHAQQLSHLQRGGHHSLPEHAAQRRALRGPVDSLARGNRRHACARGPAGDQGHLLRHGVGIAVGERRAGGAS